MSSTDRPQLPEPLSDANTFQRQSILPPISHHHRHDDDDHIHHSHSQMADRSSSSYSSASLEAGVPMSASRSSSTSTSTSTSRRKRRINEEEIHSCLPNSKKMKLPSPVAITPTTITSATTTTNTTTTTSSPSPLPSQSSLASPPPPPQASIENWSWQVENLQRQIVEMNDNFSTERGKLREQVIMHTFKLRMKEDEWSMKERNYIQQIEHLNAEIERVRSQQQQQQQLPQIHQQGTSVTSPDLTPSVIRTTSPSSSVSMQSHHHQRYLEKYKNETIDDETDRSMCDVSDSTSPKVAVYTFDMSKEREAIEQNGPPPSYHTTCCPLGVVTDMKRERRSEQPDETKQLPSASSIPYTSEHNNEKIPSISAILPMPVDLVGATPYDTASRMVNVIAQKDSQIQEQKLVIEKLQYEIAALKEYSSKLSSKQSREQRGNRLGKRYDFPKEATTILKKWITDHMQNPYPTKDEKEDLSKETGLTVTQLNDWFTNYRRRHLRNVPSDKSHGTSSSSQNNPTIVMPSPTLKTESS